MKISTGLKTLDRLGEVKLVSSALDTGAGYYNSLKGKHIILTGSFNIFEFSLKTIQFAATPIITVIKKPGRLHLEFSLQIIKVAYSL